MFSVIIPTYNRADRIRATLDSVKAQSYRPIEIIVVDDGSTDETASVVNAWRMENEEFEGSSQSLLTLRYERQSNAKAAAARNRGLKYLRGRYVQFLDSDDRLHPERFKILAETFEESEADFIQTSIQWFDPRTGEMARILKARPGANQVDLVIKGVFWANTLRGALRKDLVDKIGPWNEKNMSFEDREYMERAVMQATRPIALAPVLGYLARGEGEHFSDIHRTHEGRRWRIHSEAQLVEQVQQRDDISAQLKSALASRIYRVGCRSAARGWHDHARSCVDIADRLDAPRSFFARVKRRLCLLGPVGGKCYHWVCRAKGLPENY